MNESQEIKPIALGPINRQEADLLAQAKVSVDSGKVEISGSDEVSEGSRKVLTRIGATGLNEFIVVKGNISDSSPYHQEAHYIDGGLDFGTRIEQGPDVSPDHISRSLPPAEEAIEQLSQQE